MADDDNAAGNAGSTIMPNPHQVIVDTLNANAINNVYHNTPGDADLKSRLDPIPDASHTRNRKISPPDSQCLPGTRCRVLDKIKKWADKSLLFKPSHIYWLYGYVGCGKSSIAQEVAERFHRKGRLAASFFFFRSSERRSRFKSFPATLAWQMAAAIPATAPLILTALKSEVDLSSISVGAQMELLIYKPLKTFLKQDNGFWAMSLVKPFLIMIDGLDECKDQDQVAEFINHALSYFKDHPRFPLRFFITSRVEERIRACLDCDQVSLNNLIGHSPQEDILKYIRAVFEDAKKLNRVIRAYGDWPGIEGVEGLAKVSGGSFIFISMLLRYILSSENGDGCTPRERLPLALDMNSGLDHLYTETLRRSQDLPHFSSIISTLACLQKPFSTSEIAKLLDIELYQVTAVLINLHSIIHLPGDDITPVTLCHTSLQDFLTTKSRSGPFYAPPIHNRNIALQCIRLIILHYQTTTPLQPMVEYATNYMRYHFELSLSPYDNLETGQQLYTMATTYLIQKFPDSFSLVISTWMMMKRFGQEYPFRADVVAGFLGPTVPDAELITKILHVVIDSAPSTGGGKSKQSKHGFWKACLVQSYPALLDPSHHTFLAKQCVRCFVAERPPSTNPERRLILEYACTNWVFHLGMSVEHDPSVDLKLLQDIDILSTPFPPIKIEFTLRWKHLENHNSTVMAIERRFPGIKMSNPDRWVIVPSPPKDGICIQAKCPLSFIDLLDAFGQILRGNATRVRFVDGQGSVAFAIGEGHFRAIAYIF